jgi:hypothetical protein
MTRKEREMHVNDGELRALIDHELDPRRQAEVEAHLLACASCFQKAETVQARAAQVSECIASLTPSSGAALSNVKALARFANYQEKKEGTNMWNKIFSRRYRPAWVTFTLVLILGLALLSPQVRVAASNFLGIFRVQRFTVVQVDPSNLEAKLGSTSQLENLLSKDVQFEQLGEEQTASSPEQASSLAGIPVRLPTALAGQPELTVHPGSHATFNIDLNLVRTVLAELGRSDIQLPDSLDGAAVNVELPPAVAAQYGDCQVATPPAEAAPDGAPQPELSLSPDCTTLLQLASPTADVPEGLDIAKLGEVFLELSGMTPEEAAHFSQNLDWTTTFVIPIPRDKTTFMDVSVDGVSATFIREQYRNSDGRYLLVWVKDNVVYLLSGSGGVSSAVEIANSLATP